jgi:hypothetical protein
MSDIQVRETPRISVNKLAEYMTASAARRRGIIRDQKIKRDFIAARYQHVYAAVAECLATGQVTAVYRHLKELYDAVPSSTWELQDNQLSIEALELFLTFFDDIDLSAYSVSRPTGGMPKMVISGTEISVRPCVLLKSRDTSNLVGAVHVYVSKLLPFDDETGAYATAAVHQFAETVLGAKRPATTDAVVVDIFTRRVHLGPRAYKRRRNDLAAACEEIAQRWSAV